jgi:ABC-2 type transport system permease protein
VSALRPRRLWAIARKEAVQLRRDSRSLIIAFVMPVLLLVLFGYAITFDVRDVRTAVLDQDLSKESRAFLDAFRASGYFTVVATLERQGEVREVLDAGRAQLVLIVPPDFSRRLGGPRPPQVQAVLDGSDANTATLVGGYLSGTVAEVNRRLAAGSPVVGASGGPAAPFTVDVRVWYNEELESTNTIVPGLVAVIMMIIAALLTSLTIAREWERGTMEQLASTPVSRLEVVLGKLLPYLGIGLVDTAAASALGVGLFGVPFRGSPLLLMGLSFFFLVGALGLGMFISAAVRSQLLASQAALVATLLPAFLLSGFMFDIAVMPRPLQLLTYLIPARYFLVVTRGLFLKGVGVEVLAVQGALMIAFAAIGLGLAARTFKKEIAS